MFLTRYTPLQMHICDIGAICHTQFGVTPLWFSTFALSFPQLYSLPLFSMATGTSPYHVSTPTPGRYSLLVLAEHGGQTASLLLWFEVIPASGRLEVTAILRSISSNASVLVEFAANRLGTEFQCSTGDEAFQRCECVDGEILTLTLTFSQSHLHFYTLTHISYPHPHIHILTLPFTFMFSYSHPHTPTLTLPPSHRHQSIPDTSEGSRSERGGVHRLGN